MIEQKCKEIMNEFEERITTIEEALKNKCDERKVRDIIKEELASGTKGDTPQESTTTQQKATSNTQEVLTELEDRKKRENNILVFGVKEQTNNDGSERKKQKNRTANKERKLDPDRTKNHRNSQDRLKCFYTNADSLPNKLHELKFRLTGKEADIIGITEIYPKNARYLPQKSEFLINGYDLFMNDNNKNCHRGVGIYVKEGFKGGEVNIGNVFKESVSVKINLSDKNCLLIGCLYKSPNSSAENVEELNNIIATVSSNPAYSHLLLIGDINMPKINWNTWSSNNDREGENFIECLRDNYLYQHVREHTRDRKGNEPSILDLIITNEDEMIKDISYESPIGSSDHLVLIFDIFCKTLQSVNETPRLKYSKGDYNGMRGEMPDDWTGIMHGNIAELHQGNKKDHMPLKESILKKINKKHRAWQRYMETKSEEKYKEYAKIRNQLKWGVRKSKRELEKKIAEDIKEQPKKFWKYVNSKRKVKTGISDLKGLNGDDTKIAVRDKDKAEVLAKFFSSVFTHEPLGDLPEFNKSNIVHPFEDIICTQQKVEKLLSDLNENKSQGPDMMHPKILKELRKHISKPLSEIFNKSLQDGKLPKAWKEANITAVFKKGSKSEAGNYRPVSLTSIVGKTLEN
ncbi:uncharacterized protein LOC117336708 [Pecten maximus]|uniref:uncharacterized protein LOC117336708 n=1 Tax=Pecten maximus TaxID=6579 RepID=UPI001458C216|nr:uncharacterized protein LOC117336708 [Pecten maximus]